MEKEHLVGCATVSYCNVVCIAETLNENKYIDNFLYIIDYFK